MVIKYLIALYLIIFFHSLSYGQTPTNLTSLPKVIPQSPNTAAFKKFGDIPVSYYTGVPDISVPLYYISIDNVSLPVSLSFHASGIKVAEEAGRTGLGWSLIAGSSITRTIRGEDDFVHSLDGTYSYHSASNPAPELMLKGKDYQELYPILNDDHGFREATKSKIYPGVDMTAAYSQVNLYDMEPDLYQFNFPGYSGKFIMKHNKEVILEKKSNIKIECIGINADSWIITSTDGTKYFFEQTETFKDSPNGIVFTRKTAWHITKIITIHNKEILFTYTPQQTILTTSIGNVSEYKSDCTIYCNEPDIPYTLTISNSNEYQVPLLNEILFDNGKVTFTYDNIREDLQDSKLNQVEIFNKEGEVYKSIKKWQLNYEYFNGTSDVSYNISGTGVPASQYYKRLKLKSVVEQASDGRYNPPYEFTYNNETGVSPSKASFARDHYGYYNGKLGKLHLIPEFSGVSCIASIIGNMDNSRSVGADYVKLFNINSIKYPTGGRTDFDFMANTFDLSNSGTTLSDEGVVVPGFQSKSYNGNIYNQYQPLPIDFQNKLMDLTDMAVTAGNTGSPVTMSVFFLYSGNPRSLCPETSTPFSNLTVTLCKEDGTPVTPEINPYYSSNSTCAGSSGNYVGINFQNTYNNLTPAKYFLKVYIDASVNYISNISVGLSYNAYQLPVINSLNGQILLNAGYGGGLRIQKITDFDQSGNKTNIKKFDYVFTDEYGKLRSAGRRLLKPDYSYIEQVVSNTCSYGYRLMRVSDSYLPLTAYSGNLIGYDKVTVYYGENGENGKSEYNYFNAAGNPLTYIDASSPLNGQLPAGDPNYYLGLYESPAYMPKPKIPPFAILPVTDNGNLLNAIDYKFTSMGSYQIIKTEENVYTNFFAGQNIYWWAVQQTPRKFVTSASGSVSLSNYGLSSYRKNYPALVLTRNELTSKTTVLYDQSDILKNIRTVQTFQYDNTTHLQLLKQETYNSKGELLKTEYKYPYDFAAPQGSTPNIYNSMLTRNIISPVIEQKNFINGTQFLQSYKTNYYDWGNSILTPKTIDVQKGTTAIETRLRYNSYDSRGNPLSVSKENDVNIAYLWDYLSTYPIAEVENTVYNDIAYTSFEADAKGNWQFTGLPSQDVTALTGKKTYMLNGVTTDISKSGLNNATTYIVSYWTKNTVAFNIAGTIAGYPIQGRTLNGWNYFEHKITGVSVVTISGSGSIDEVRLYPEKALMKTYAYTPLIGITSQCDANNRITYYEYDSFNRLTLIKDQDNNILKKICYNYAGQVENCVTCLNLNPDWQNTLTALRCLKDASNQNTGYQEQEQKDVNPCSSLYNSFRWVVVGYNPTACPLPASCNTSNCTGINKKCVYGVCETGVLVYDDYGTAPNGSCRHYYHYEWSDGTWSGQYSSPADPAYCNGGGPIQ